MDFRTAGPQTNDTSPGDGDFQPLRVCTVDLEKPLETLSAVLPDMQHRYGGARILVRLHGQPLGLLDLDFDGVISPARLADLVWREMHQTINDHLVADGLGAIGGLPVTGLPPSHTPRCMSGRESVRAAAPFASVVICTRDRPDTLQAALESLSALNYPDFELILVDNAPRTDAARDLFTELFGDTPNRVYIREPRPGLSNARNCGLAHARGEIIAFSDDDARADPFWLAELAQALAFSDRSACATGLSLAAEIETASQFWFDQGGGFNKGFSRRVFDMGEHRSPGPLFPYAGGLYGSGLNMSFRTHALREIGGFDPALGAGSPSRGGEDLDIFVRLILKGYQIVYEPRALIHHVHRRGFAALKKQMAGYGVGLTALLTRWAADDPTWLLRMIPKLPAALLYVVGPGSGKNRARRADYPLALTLAEWGGMLFGPIAYLHSRWNMLWSRQHSDKVRVGEASQIHHNERDD